VTLHTNGSGDSPRTRIRYGITSRHIFFATDSHFPAYSTGSSLVMSAPEQSISFVGPSQTMDDFEGGDSFSYCSKSSRGVTYPTSNKSVRPYYCNLSLSKRYGTGALFNCSHGPSLESLVWAPKCRTCPSMCPTINV